MIETFSTDCYIEYGGKTVFCTLAGYDDGRAVLLYSSQKLGTGTATTELRASGVNMHSKQSATWISAPDSNGVAAAYPGAIVHLPGSPIFESMRANKRTRGGSAPVAAAPVAAAPVAAAPVAAAPVAAAPVAAAPVAAAPVAAAPVASDDDTPAAAAIDCTPVVMQTLKDSNNQGLIPVITEHITAAVNAYAAALLDTVTVDNIPASNCGAPVVESLSRAGLDALKDIANKVLTAPLNSWLAGLISARVEEIQAAAPAAAPAGIYSVVQLPGKYQVTNPDGAVQEFEGAVHPAFEEVLQDLDSDRYVYLFGPAGTGKGYMVRQLADVLGVPYYMSGKSDLKYDLTGSPDINGKLMETQFYKAFSGGGLWHWDEPDRSSSDSGTAINEALANGYCDFPGVGVVKMHPDFYCVGAGNTLGKGRSQKYAGAQVQDESLLTRFVSKIPIDYCPEMDMIVTGGDSDLCAFAADFRAALAAIDSDKDLAIRLLMPMKRKAARRGYVRALQTGILAGMDKTQIRMISARCKGNTPWHKALHELAA